LIEFLESLSLSRLDLTRHRDVGRDFELPN